MFAWMRQFLVRNAANYRQTKVFVKPLFLISLFCLICLILTSCQANNLGMLNPKGIIAFHQRKLLFDTTALMLIVVLPVIVMSLTFIFHYQASHRIRDYQPNWAHSYLLESIWWLIPCAIIFVLAIITWKKTHELDPYNRIAMSSEPPLLIEVIALPWKWLFIYPEQNIATLNYVVMPVGRQVEYWLTTDNVAMSSFLIPQLGSQIFVMAGMRTKLHLLANYPGTYDGMNTQYNGNGFSDMRFKVYAVSANTMERWFLEAKKTSQQLTPESYAQLLNPSVNAQPAYFAGVIPNLFENVVMTYMHTFGTVHPRENQLKWHKD